jgi:hypothetical protein
VCVIIATKEELTNNVLVGFKDDLVVCGLRGTLNKLLDKCIDALPDVSAISNLHWMLMNTDMNAEFLGPSHARRRFLPRRMQCIWEALCRSCIQ